jgi:hypothetical protein
MDFPKMTVQVINIGGEFHLTIPNVTRVCKLSDGRFCVTSELTERQMIVKGRDPDNEENDITYEYDSSKYFLVVL